MYPDLWVMSFGSLYSKGWCVTHTLSQSVWKIYVLQNRIVYIIKRLNPLFLDPYFQFCKYRHASKSFVYLYLHLLIVIYVGSSPRTFTVRSICETESLFFWHIFLNNRRYFKKNICFALVPRLAAYFSSDVFQLNSSSNNMIVNNFQPYVPGRERSR